MKSEIDRFLWIKVKICYARYSKKEIVKHSIQRMSLLRTNSKLALSYLNVYSVENRVFIFIESDDKKFSWTIYTVIWVRTFGGTAFPIHRAQIFDPISHLRRLSLNSDFSAFRLPRTDSYFAFHHFTILEYLKDFQWDFSEREREMRGTISEYRQQKNINAFNKREITRL